MNTAEANQITGPTKENIRWMLGLKTKTRVCKKTTERLRAARKDFGKPTEYMLAQQRAVAALMNQLVGHPIRQYP